MTDKPPRPVDDAEVLHERAERQVRDLEARVAEAEQRLEQQARERTTTSDSSTADDRPGASRD